VYELLVNHSAKLVALFEPVKLSIYVFSLAEVRKLANLSQESLTQLIPYVIPHHIYVTPKRPDDHEKSRHKVTLLFAFN